MKFQETPSEIKPTTFEVEEATTFTEHGVAMNALGLLTVKYANDEEKRLPPARLGTELAAIAHASNTEENKDKTPPKPQPITRDLRSADAELLHEALDELINSAPSTIAQLAISQYPHASSGRAVEVDMAKKMQAQLEEAFGFSSHNSTPPIVGFQ